MFNESALKDLERQTGMKSAYTVRGIGEIVSVALNYAFTFAGIALLLYFIFGGFQLFTSGGDQKKVAEGKATITNAVVGFVIVFVAFWIVQFFGSVLGLQPLIGTGGLFTK